MKEQKEFYLIHTYSIRHAIADGVLVDVTDEAKSFGFCIPVAITGNLISCYIEPDAACEALGQSFSGRLRDVLAVLSFEARRAKGDRLTFKVAFLMDADTGHRDSGHSGHYWSGRWRRSRFDRHASRGRIAAWENMAP